MYSVPLENIDCKMQIEDEYFVKSDPGLAKLQNSDILRNLDKKLSHLDLSLRLELSKLIAIVFRCSYYNKQIVSQCRCW